MTDTIVITLPAGDPALQDELEQQLAPYGDVYVQPPQSFDLNTVKLVVEITASAISAAGGAATLIDKVIDIGKKLAQENKAQQVRIGAPGTPGTPLADADETLLRELLGVD